MQVLQLKNKNISSLGHTLANLAYITTKWGNNPCNVPVEQEIWTAKHKIWEVQRALTLVPMALQLLVFIRGLSQLLLKKYCKWLKDDW
jgi:hypothetical protein